MPGVVENGDFRGTLDSRSRNLDTTFSEQSSSPLSNMKGGSRTRYPNGYGSDQMSDTTDDSPRYLLEHLATFSVASEFGIVSPKDGLRRLLQMEKSNGIWTQKMQMKLDKNWVLILDYEDGDVVEKFPMNLISDPTAYTSDDPRELYNNILVFIVREDPKSKNPNQSEMHIFQCARVYAQDVVDEMKMFIAGKAKPKSSDNIRHLPPPPHNPPPDPPVNGNSSKVREHVAMFSASAMSASPTHSTSMPRGPSVLQQRIERASGYARESNDETSSTTSDKYEREVVILNHCFDDIERFVVRLQHAAAAYKELERRQKSRKHKKKDMGDGMLSIRAKPPPEREFMDVLQKFKLSFNLLAKLKSHIHDPNAPELVHFLFTPLALIIDAARDSNHSANLAARVVSPVLTRDSIELLANCCTSKETDLWHSLGDSWTIPRDQWKGYESNYQPIFSNGWAPELVEETNSISQRMQRAEPDLREQDYQRVFSHPDREGRFDSEYFCSERDEARNESPSVLPDNSHMRQGFERPYDHLPAESRRGIIDRNSAMSPESDFHDPRDRDLRSEFSSDSIEHSDMPLSPQRQFDHQQMQWLDDLKNRRAKVVQVVYPRTANNEKELTVVRGEILEVLDDSRKWWKARNMQGQVAHVPHTIVTSYPALDDDLFNNPVYGSRNSRESYYSPYMSPGKEQYMDGSLRSQEAGRSPTSSGMSRPAPADWVRRERQGKKGYHDDANITFGSESDDSNRSDTPLPSPPSNHIESLSAEDSQSPPHWLPPPPGGIHHKTSIKLSTFERRNPSHHHRSDDHSILKGPIETHNFSNPVRPFSAKDNSSSEKRKSLLKRSSAFESSEDPSATTVHQQLQEELKASIAQKKGQRISKMVLCPEHEKYDCYCITPNSTKNEVIQWLELNNFSQKAQSSLEHMTTETLFNSSKLHLEKILGKEGLKLYSYLLIQKNICGRNTSTSGELSSILAERRQKTDIEAE